MSEQSRKTPVLALTGTGVEAASRLMSLIKGAVLLVSVAAAVPTAHNLYYSWKEGIPFGEVSHRLTQYELWMKNLECNVEYRQLSTAGGTKVDVGACPKTGDISIKVASESGQAAYEWIAFQKLQRTAAPRVGSLLDLIVPQVLAATAAGKSAEDGTLRVAQANIQTVCQKRSGDKIVRIVKDGAKCFRETFSPLKGTVESRQEVACTAQC